MEYVLSIPALIAIVIGVINFKKAKRLKDAGEDYSKEKKTWIVALVVTLLLSCAVAAVSPEEEGKEEKTKTTVTQKKDTESKKDVPKKSGDNENKNLIVLKSGEKNEYYQERYLNKGTADEDLHHAYIVPAGTYKVENKGDKRTQVNVYKDEVKKTEEGFEEWADTKMVILLMQGESGKIIVDEGYFVDLDDPYNVTLEKK